MVKLVFCDQRKSLRFKITNLDMLSDRNNFIANCFEIKKARALKSIKLNDGLMC